MIKKFKENKLGRDFVVGDIHGCFSKLQKALDDMRFNTEFDRLFCTGDLIDRGPESELCLSWLAKPWFHSVMGNHDIMPKEYLEGNWPVGLYIQNGGAWFLSLHEVEQKEIALALSELPYLIEIEGSCGRLFGLVHAGFPTDNWGDARGLLQCEKSKQSMLWDRRRVKYGVEDLVNGVTYIFSGHTVVERALQLGNHFFVDTGAVFNRSFTISELTW